MELGWSKEYFDKKGIVDNFGTSETDLSSTEERNRIDSVFLFPNSAS